MESFPGIMHMKAGPRKTAALAQWVQGLYNREGARPVLVGGAAVELFTGGAYVTGDLDFVGSATAAVASALKQAGFNREGRHWYHEKGHLFLEFASRTLKRDEEARDRVFGDCSVIIISSEDLITNLLAAWVRFRSVLDGFNAFLLYRAVEAELDLKKLEGRAVQEDVYAALDSVRELFVEFKGDIPDEEILLRWAQPWKRKGL